MAALGERDDWTDLRIYGALLLAWSEAFRHPNVHYLSGFFGPVERALRDAGANISFAPADFRRFEPLLEQQAPRVMATVASPPDESGWCSLSLHAGGTVEELARAGADANRLLIVEVSPHFPRTSGLPPGAPARDSRRSDRRPRRLRGAAVRASRARAGGDRRGDRRPRAPLRRRRRHPADGDRDDPLGDRRPARGGRRRRLRGPFGDVHQRAHAPAPGRQGDQPQGPVRRRLGRHLRRRLAGALRLARGQRPGRLPAGRGRQLARPDRPQPDDGDDQRARSRSTSTARSSPTRSTAASTRGSAATRTSSPARRSRSRTARCSACRRP